MISSERYREVSVWLVAKPWSFQPWQNRPQKEGLIAKSITFFGPEKLYIFLYRLSMVDLERIFIETLNIDEKYRYRVVEV